jgi:hypothetical protein
MSSLSNIIFTTAVTLKTLVSSSSYLSFVLLYKQLAVNFHPLQCSSRFVWLCLHSGHMWRNVTVRPSADKSLLCPALSTMSHSAWEQGSSPHCRSCPPPPRVVGQTRSFTSRRKIGRKLDPWTAMHDCLILRKTWCEENVYLVTRSVWIRHRVTVHCQLQSAAVPPRNRGNKVFPLCN